MADRHSSPTSDAPEALPGQTRATFGFIGSDDYEYYEPPPSAFERQRSPVPEYQPEYEPNSARVSAASPPPPSSDVGRSPQLSDSGFSKSRPLSPSVQYSEIHSPDPQRVYNDPQGEKEAVYSPDPHHSKVPSYYAAPTLGIHHQDSTDRPQVWSDASQQYPQEQQQSHKAFYKRWWFIVGIIFLIVAIAVAVPVGVVFGTKKHNNNSNSSGGSSSSGASGTSGSGNPDTSVGGNLNAAYYSKAGAFNGSGIAIAAANPNLNQAIYAFYQDYTGALQYTVYDSKGQWNLIGPVNAGSYKALNGTPLSAVQHQLAGELRWHLFYIDEDYIIRERIITNTSTTGPSAIWTDGPLSSQNLKTWQSDSIGLQACYWGDYYGQWSYNTTQATAGIHIWYASDSTTFQQYNWANGTNKWTFDQEWNDLSGNGGVGCQTWYSMTEYVWFVDTNNKIQMYWKDNNHSTTATSSHPINAWTSVNIGVSNVQRDSSLGYTNYMVWQDMDTSIKGANVMWAAENTTINSTDTWTLQTNNANVKAIRGTHLSVTAVKTGSEGALLQVFFQSTGNDVEQYNRDAYTPNALWSQAPAVPVAAPS